MFASLRPISKLTIDFSHRLRQPSISPDLILADFMPPLVTCLIWAVSLFMAFGIGAQYSDFFHG
jgi:hypothetical protein